VKNNFVVSVVNTPVSAINIPVSVVSVVNIPVFAAEGGKWGNYYHYEGFKKC
jgi:hypothetical protein